MDRFTVIMESPALRPSIYWGSLLHGILMELLPAAYRELLHGDGLRPMSMYVTLKTDTMFEWNILSVDDELSSVIADVIKPGMSLECKNQSTVWNVTDVKRETTTVAGYMSRIFLAPEPCRGISISLITPATHKTGGKYAIFPSVSMIVENLRRHVTAAFPELPYSDDNVMQDILNNTYISRYELRSSTYNLEGHYVPGYYGRFEIHFEGPDALRRLAETLFTFAQWCGIGAKTALGMGGCRIERLPERKAKA